MSQRNKLSSQGFVKNVLYVLDITPLSKKIVSLTLKILCRKCFLFVMSEFMPSNLSVKVGDITWIGNASPERVQQYVVTREQRKKTYQVENKSFG